MKSQVFGGLGTALLWLVANTGVAQISTDIIEQHQADFEKQATDADMKREAGTEPRDWNYELPAGVRTRLVTFYVDGGTALHGKLFLPKGFRTTSKWPAVVVGHGINALSIGIEKYAARFAERGLVAMSIDYQSYGFSTSGSDDIRLLEPDPSTDDSALTERELRVVAKRTNLNNVHEVEDYRAAISFLQGEPGVDPERIGIWGSSNAGTVVTAVSALDARVKATVVQVMTPRPGPRRPVAISQNNLEDAITRVRTGQGNQIDGGFSFKSKVDQWYLTRNQDVQAGAWLDQIPNSNHFLFLPAEKDELMQYHGRLRLRQISKRTRCDFAGHRLSGFDALPGVLLHRFRSRIDAGGGLVRSMAGRRTARAREIRQC
jgi:dienelactone hydrolase